MSPPLSLVHRLPPFPWCMVFLLNLLVQFKKKVPGIVVFSLDRNVVPSVSTHVDDHLEGHNPCTLSLSLSRWSLFSLKSVEATTNAASPSLNCRSLISSLSLAIMC